MLTIKTDGFEPCVIPPEVEAEGAEAMEVFVAENAVPEPEPDPAPAPDPE